MALGTTTLAEEDSLPRKLLLGRLARIEPSERIKLRGRREIDDVLHLRHHRDMIDPVGSIDAFALSADMVAVEVGRALHSPLHWYGVRPLWNRCGLPRTRCC